MDIGKAEIERMHRQRGFRTIGYHYVIRRDGTVEKGRPDNTPGAHCRTAGMNGKSLGICLVGGSPPTDTPEFRKGLGEDNFTPLQKVALETLLHELLETHTDAEVIGHRDVPGVRKACPSFDVKEWWSKIIH